MYVCSLVRISPQAALDGWSAEGGRHCGRARARRYLRLAEVAAYERFLPARRIA